MGQCDQSSEINMKCVLILAALCVAIPAMASTLESSSLPTCKHDSKACYQCQPESCPPNYYCEAMVDRYKTEVHDPQASPVIYKIQDSASWWNDQIDPQMGRAELCETDKNRPSLHYFVHNCVIFPDGCPSCAANCRPKRPENQECKSGKQCYSGVCNHGLCVTSGRLPDGSSCLRDGECQSGRCMITYYGGKRGVCNQPGMVG